MVTQLLSATNAPPAVIIRAFHLYVYGGIVFSGSNDRDSAVDAIITAATKHVKDQQLVGGALCALHHVSGGCQSAPVPVSFILSSLRRHMSSAQFVSAGLRLLCGHASSSRVLEMLPEAAGVTADCLAIHKEDDGIAGFGARIIIAYNAVDQSLLSNGAKDDLAVATVRAAVSSRVINYHVDALPWQTHILTKLHARLRG